jgi:hypothetical protein
MISLFVIINIEKNPSKCIYAINSPFNFLSMQFMKVHFQFYFILKELWCFIFANWNNLQIFLPWEHCWTQIHIFIFGWNYVFIFIKLLHFSTNFQEFYSMKMKKSKEEIVLPKCGFNFLLANWFNYLKSIIQFKTFTNIYNV